MVELDFQIEEWPVNSTGMILLYFNFLSHSLLSKSKIFYSPVFSQERNTDIEITDLSDTLIEYSKMVLAAF